MFVPISMDGFLKATPHKARMRCCLMDYLKTNPEENRVQARKTRTSAVEAKRFTCIRDEADNSEDYEIDSAIL